MDPATTIDFARSAILVLLEIIAPSMITALVVGSGHRLAAGGDPDFRNRPWSSCPRIVAIFVVLLLALPFAGAALSGLMTDIASRIAAY